MPPPRKVSAAPGKDAATRTKAVEYLSEDKVLKPVSKGQDPDDWPCFVLGNAVVYSKDGARLANLLHTEEEGPFMMRGILEVDKDFRKLCKCLY